jgi:hypothetical protein
MRSWLILSTGFWGCGDESGTDDEKDTTFDAIPVDGDAGDADTDADSDADADADGDTDVDIDTATDSGSTRPCETTVIDRFPLDGDVDVYARTDIWFVLTESDPSATITVTDAGGTAVSGTTTVDDLIVTWVGDPLVVNSDYEARLDYLCGSEVTHFATSDVGEPLGVDPTGTVYAIDLGTGIWVEPIGLGSLLSAQLGNTDLLVTPTAITPTSIELLGAVGTYAVQNVCVPTIPLPSALWVDPYFELTSPLIPLDFGGVAVEVADVELSGSFASDGSRIQFGVLKGLIDTRPLGEVLGLGSSEDAVCQLLVAFGLACEPCLDGATYCMSVWVDDLEAPDVPGTVVPRSTSDIAGDPICP